MTADPIAQEIWALSDGRAGLLNQVLGLAEAVAAKTGFRVVEKTVRLRRPWRDMPARLMAGPAFALPFSGLERGLEALAPPWPRLLIACGRQSLPFSLAIRRLSKGGTFTVQTQDPRLPARLFDLVVPPRHDALSGPNVYPILGSPNRVTAERLSKAAESFRPRYAHLPFPRVGVLIGGRSKAYRLGTEEAEGIAAHLLRLAGVTGAGLMITASRRTGEDNIARLRAALAPLIARSQADFAAPGEGENPYFGVLALADFLLVTVDSINMATEAAATGKPIHVLGLPGGAAKFNRFHDDLRALGIARPFEGRLEPFAYPPLDETARAAGEIVARAGLA